MEIVKLKAKTKDYLWGGHRLFDYGKDGRDIIKANQLMRDKEELAMIKEIKKQVEIDKKNRINDVNLKKQMVNQAKEEK